MVNDTASYTHGTLRRGVQCSNASAREQVGPAPTAAVQSLASGPTVGEFEVQGLHAFYSGVEALRNISMTLERHRITALIGPSGCGKSTFLRCLNRMNDVIPGFRLQGSVEMNGADIYDRKVDVVELRKRVGMVFQQPNPFPASIFDNIAYGPRLHGARGRVELAEIVERALTQAALWAEVKDHLKRPAYSLSGGQQQRLCIARALAVEPQVVLMDEPCSSLDPNATFRIEELMLSLKEKYTIVIVTHNMYQAARVAQRTGFFLMGELVEFGDTDMMFGRPSDPRTEDYIRGRFG